MGRLAVTTEKWLLIKRQTFCTILHYKNLLPGGESSTFHIWSSRCKFLVTIVFIVKFLCHFLHVLHMCSAAGKTHNISTSNIFTASYIYTHFSAVAVTHSCTSVPRGQRLNYSGPPPVAGSVVFIYDSVDLTLDLSSSRVKDTSRHT